MNEDGAVIFGYKVKDPSRYGVVKFNGINMLDFEEKPSWTTYINAGIYIIEPKIIETIEKGQAIDMPTWINRMTSNDVKISIFPIF